MTRNASTSPSNTVPSDAHARPVDRFVVDPGVDPRDVWMSALDVHDYLRMGRSQGSSEA